jgi:hypothetical protein
MLVTLFGIVIEVKLVQLLNALMPILVTLSGIITEVKFQQPLNASWPMLVTLLPIITILTSAALWTEFRQTLVPSFVLTVSVPVVVSKLHPSPENVCAETVASGIAVSIILTASKIAKICLIISKVLHKKVFDIF